MDCDFAASKTGVVSAPENFHINETVDISEILGQW